MIKITGTSELTWSNTEKVWPFEKDKQGRTLYCKEVPFGALPYQGVKTIAHGIPSPKIH